MGGLAAVIGWHNTPEPDVLNTMATKITHRGPAGIKTTASGTALLAEARFARDGAEPWQIATDGPLTLVGDVRLWNTTRLRSLAGNPNNASDRHLLLSVYRRIGVQFLDAVDGDFAFVIWDSDRRHVLAARDRFGAKPLWVAESTQGIAFASEPKQLFGVVGGTNTPNPLSMVQHLTNTYLFDPASAYMGIERVLPAHVLTAGETASSTRRYWTPTPSDVSAADDVIEGFRHHMTEAASVRTSGATMCHLSGGLDSSSVAAAAASAPSIDPTSFRTVSMVAPGTDSDDGPRIRDIAEMQPFEHIEFEQRITPTIQFTKDIKTFDAPIALLLRDVYARPGEIGAADGFDTLLTGYGGDDVGDDQWLFSDLMKARKVSATSAATATVADDSKMLAAFRLWWGVRRLPPARIKAPLRTLRRSPISLDMAGTDLETAVAELTEAVRSQPRPSNSAEALALSTQSGTQLTILEIQEAMLAAYGVEPTHPFLDRTVIEYTMGIPPDTRPVHSLGKSVLRAAFGDQLPASVINRRSKTTSNELLAHVFSAQASDYIARYQEVPIQATGLIDADSYHQHVAAAQASASADQALDVWRTWALFDWLETLS